MPCIRCAARKANGDQCRLTTCARSPYCWIHLRSINKLEVKFSTIAGAGRGLFTTIARARGERIVQYTGEQLNQRQLDVRYPGDMVAEYAFQVRKGRGGIYIDSRDPQHSSVARYANDCRAGVCNARFTIQRDNTVWLKATRDIEPGEEIFVAYGESYWR